MPKALLRALEPVAAAMRNKLGWSMLSRDRKPDPPWALRCLCLSLLFLRWPLGCEKLRMLITTNSHKGDILSQDCQGKDRSRPPPVFVLAEALDNPILRSLKPAPPLSGVRSISSWRLGRKTGGGKTRPYGNLTHSHLPISPNQVLLSRSTTKAVHLTKTVKRCTIEGIRFKIRHPAHG